MNKRLKCPRCNKYTVGMLPDEMHSWCERLAEGLPYKRKKAPPAIKARPKLRLIVTDWAKGENV